MDYYGGTNPRLGRYGGNSPRVIKCNYLTGCRVQPAPTRYRSGLGSPSLRQEPAPTRPGARRRSLKYLSTIDKRYEENTSKFIIKIY